MHSFKSMKVLKPSNSTHSFKFIPRHDISGAVTMTIKNLDSTVTGTVANSYTYSDGIAEITFDYEVVEGYVYNIILEDSTGEIYRGEMIGIEDDVQDYDISEKYITYE